MPSNFTNILFNVIMLPKLLSNTTTNDTTQTPIKIQLQTKPVAISHYKSKKCICKNKQSCTYLFILTLISITVIIYLQYQPSNINSNIYFNHHINNKANLHSAFNWNWYEQNVINISNKQTVCVPPPNQLQNGTWKQNGYSLIECYFNPLFNETAQPIEILKTDYMWKVSNYDERLLAYYSVCKLYNVYITWSFTSSKYVNIFANCQATNGHNVLTIEKRINKNRHKIFSNANKYTQPFKLTIRKFEPIQSETEHMIYQISDRITQCGVYMWKGDYAFANPWHCMNGLIGDFALNKYLNQPRDKSVLFLPSYERHGWRRNKLDVPHRIPDSQFYLFSSLYKFFVPHSKLLPNLDNQTEMDGMLNQLFIEKTFKVDENYHTFTKAVSELQIHYHIPMAFDPFFNISANGVLLQEYRKYLISYFDSIFSDYNWIKSLIQSDYFCFAFDKNVLCNNRPNMANIINTNEIEYFIEKLSSNSTKIMFFADRSVCYPMHGIKQCKCSIRRCVHSKIQLKWISALISNFSTNYLIVYGNPAYLSFETHYHLTRHLDIVVSVHGASLAFQIFMYTPQKVFELTTKTSIHLAKMLNIPYYGYPLKHKGIKIGLSPYISMTKDWSFIITFDIQSVINSLKQFIDSRDKNLQFLDRPCHTLPHFLRHSYSCNATSLSI
eukprot:313775_1